jgi:hypothetical protein
MKKSALMLPFGFLCLGLATGGCFNADSDSDDDDDDGGTGGSSASGGNGGTAPTGGTAGSTGGTGGSVSGSGGSTSGSGGSTGGSSGSTSGSGGSMGGSGGSTSGSGGGAGAAAQGGGAGTGTACDIACERLVAAACGIESASCVTECENLESTCPEDAPGYLSCVGNAENQVSCVDGGVSVAGCNPENQAISVCLVCEPLAEDTGCGTCIKTNCCAELETYVGSSDVSAFDLCAAACADQACIDA